MSAGNSIDAPVGTFTIKVESIRGKSANISVSSDTKDTYRFKNAQSAQRLMIPAPDGTYHLDVIRIEGRTAYLVMGKQE